MNAVIMGSSSIIDKTERHLNDFYPQQDTQKAATVTIKEQRAARRKARKEKIKMLEKELLKNDKKDKAIKLFFAVLIGGLAVRGMLK